MRSVIFFAGLAAGVTMAALAAPTARAELLMDFRYSIIDGFEFADDPDGPHGNPVVRYLVFSPSVSRDSFVADFSFPVVQGENVFELSGQPLAAFAAALTNGRVDDVVNFDVEFDGDGLMGVGFREFYDFFPNQTTDLIGHEIDRIRLSVDACLQLTGTEACLPTRPGQIGFSYDLRFQAFGRPVAEIAAPAGLAGFVVGLACLAAATRRRSNARGTSPAR